MKMTLRLSALFLALVSTVQSGSAFEWGDTEGKYLDLKQGSRSIARYVYEPIDESTPERREETYKPFCHIFQPGSSEQFLTKGPGGKFTHHRGIFYGFSRISYTDKDGEKHEKVDTWHCRDAHQVHRKFLKQEADKDSASFTALIVWIGKDGNGFATEERTMRFKMENSDIVVDFESKLTSTVPMLQIDGDPQHAGFQFRANNDVSEKHSNATYYIRPESGAGPAGATINWSSKTDTEQTRDIPWKAMCMTLGDKRYTISYLDRPTNPKPARFSERDYGRFGSYFATEVPKDEPLEVRYRLVIHSGELKAESVAKLSEQYLSE
tara:strand:+ start:58 stop:1026 length:969 start_codon:yes stop_codon:yes gene_type:complete